MNKSVANVVVAVVALGAGIGAGFLINKPKLTESRKACSELQTKMDELQKTSTEKLQMMSADNAKLSTENKRINSELTRYRTEYVRASADLAQISAEMKQLKENILPQSGSVDQTASAQPAGAEADSASAQPAPAKVVVAAGEYVVKDGDNLWNIASEQLGSGVRYKEIIAVNPGITEKTTLAVGSKIKLPAK